MTRFRPVTFYTPVPPSINLLAIRSSPFRLCYSNLAQPPTSLTSTMPSLLSPSSCLPLASSGFGPTTTSSHRPATAAPPCCTLVSSASFIPAAHAQYISTIFTRTPLTLPRPPALHAAPSVPVRGPRSYSFLAVHTLHPDRPLMCRFEPYSVFASCSPSPPPPSGPPPPRPPPHVPLHSSLSTPKLP